MTLAEVLRDLKAAGTAQNRKVYARHGVGKQMFGVSFANLGKLQKKIKTDHALAQKLWATGNHDARVLATMIADPAAMTDRLLESWAHDLSNYVIAGSFATLVSKSPHVLRKMQKWTKSSYEWIGRAGWVLLAHIVMEDQTLPDSFFAKYLAVIERTIHTRKNRVRDAMNSALIAIGIRNSRLEKKALAAAKKIGRVEVDHGETGCKTPDAAEYIVRTLRYRHARR